jgi:hypothetical protein
MSSTACWSWDARATSASSDPKRGLGVVPYTPLIRAPRWLRRHGPQNGRTQVGVVPSRKKGCRNLNVPAPATFGLTRMEACARMAVSRYQRKSTPGAARDTASCGHTKSQKGIFCPWCEPVHRLLAAHCIEFGSRPLMVATLKREKHKCTSISSLSTPKSTWFLAPTASPIRQVFLSLLQPPTTVLLPLTATLSAVL